MSIDKAWVDVERVCPKSSTVDVLEHSDWVLVGNLFGGLGSFDSENVGNAYAAFEGCAEGASAFNAADDFGHAMKGWTSVEIYKVEVPFIFSSHSNITVLVPHDVLEREDFDLGVPGIYMGNGSLVAARWTSDHVFVVSEVLCKQDSEHWDCASQYERGLFDLSTGLEHTRKGVPTRKQNRIDTSTYMKIE